MKHIVALMLCNCCPGAVYITFSALAFSALAGLRVDPRSGKRTYIHQSKDPNSGKATLNSVKTTKQWEPDTGGSQAQVPSMFRQ
jgi:hypothetical protein